MAIVKITNFSSGTTPVSGDWSALVNHFNAYTRQISGFQYPVEHVSGDNLLLKKGSYIQHGGSLYQVQTEDYTVSGSLSWVIGTYNYIKIKASGETLTATLTQDISSYSWSNIYSYLIASDESQILAFCASSPEGNTINIYRLEKKDIQYKSNQNTQTDDDVEFKNINLNELTLAYESLSAGGVTWENPETAETHSTGAYVEVLSTTLSAYIKRAGASNGITGARFTLYMIHAAAGTSNRVGYIKATVSGVTVYEQQYTDVYGGTSTHSVDIATTDTSAVIKFYIKYVSGGDYSYARNPSILSFNRARTALETLFNI